MTAQPESPLRSPALGTSSNDLIRPCEAPRPARREPPPPPREPAIAVALSGGGFRASLSALGVLRFLADAGMLDQVRYASSVSGGSVANAAFAAAYPALLAQGFTPQAFDDLLLRPFVASVSGGSMQSALIRQALWTIGRKSRTEALADVLDRWFYRGQRLEDLPEQCRFIFNAGNISTGVRFGFERDVVGDYVVGQVPTRGTGLRLARAVAASAAVPGALAPLVLEGLPFPCLNGRTVRLLDGGIYDNMGLEAVDDLRDALLVALNAGGLFVTGRYGSIPIVRDLQLAESMLYRQSTALRRRWMVERFQAWEAARERGESPPPWGRRGVLFGLGTVLRPADRWTAVNPNAPVPEEVSLIETSFDRFARETCEKLVYAGWWLTGATLATYHPELFAGDLPRWRPLP